MHTRTLHIHLYDDRLPKMLFRVLLHITSRHCSKKKVRELNRPQKSVEYFLLDPLQLFRRVVYIARFPGAHNPLKWLRGLPLLEWFVLGLPVPCESAECRSIFAEAIFEVAQAHDRLAPEILDLCALRFLVHPVPLAAIWSTPETGLRYARARPCERLPLRFPIG